MDDLARIRSRHSLHSVLREKIVEHLFIGHLLQRLWQLEVFDAEVLMSEFDAGGFDLVLSWRKITRHIQLKVSRLGGARSHVDIALRLSDKPSGCVIWIEVHDDLSIASYRFFGGCPGASLPSIAELPVTRHTKGDAQGRKAERPAHRQVKRQQFTLIDTLDALIACLLGTELFEDHRLSRLQTENRGVGHPQRCAKQEGTL